MSTQNGPSTTSPDPKAITGQLHREILDLEHDHEILPEEPTDDERWAQSHLSDLPITYDPAVAAAVDALLPSRPLTEDGRAGALAAVEHELAERRRMRGPLPVVLRTFREQQGLSLPDLAAAAEIPEEQVHRLETGALTLRAAGAPTVAAWIRRLDPPREAVLAALRRSHPALDPLLAAGHDDPLTDEDIIAEIIELLGWTENRGDR